MSLDIGQTLHQRYRIVKLLGSDGVGETYLAEDCDRAGTPGCVVKFFTPKDRDPDTLQVARRLFNTEAQLLDRLGRCDRIPRLLANFEDSGQFYLVQDYIEGTRVDRELASGKPRSEAEVIDLLRATLEVLATVHRQNVIHRDIKPQHLIRCKPDGIALIDFGGIKKIGASDGVGTPGYAPIEQLEGHPKFSSDIYAVGAIAIQALTGIAPDRIIAEAGSLEAGWRDRVSVSPKLADLISTMVRRDFNQRYSNATEALAAVNGLHPESMTGISLPFPVPLWGALLGAAVVVAGIAIGIEWNSRSTPELDTADARTPAPAVPLTANNLNSTLPGHADKVLSVAVSYDGNLFASGSNNGTIKIWDARTQQLLRPLPGHAKGVTSVAFDPASQLLASGSGDGTIKIWDLRVGGLQQTLAGHEATVWSVAFTPDGKRLISGSRDETIKIWSLDATAEVQTLEAHSADVCAVAVSPDGKTLISGGGLSDRSIKLWQIGETKPKASRIAHESTVWAIAISPDGRTFASGSEDATIRLWRMGESEPFQTLTGHSAVVRSVAFSPDGTRLVSGSDDGTIEVWRVPQGEVVQTLESGSDAVRSVAFRPDGRQLVSGGEDGRVRVWNLVE